MFVRISPLISFIAAPRVLGSMEATTIVTRGGCRTRRIEAMPAKVHPCGASGTGQSDPARDLKKLSPADHGYTSY
jgi:hypothetical protein